MSVRGNSPRQSGVFVSVRGISLCQTGVLVRVSHGCVSELDRVNQGYWSISEGVLVRVSQGY